MLSWHNVEDYLLPHEMDTYVVKGTDKMFDVVFLQGMSSEPIAAKRVPTFRKYLAKHVETIRSKSSVPVVVVTWAKADKMDKDTRRLADSIIEEANRNNAIALPVGLAFAESLKERPDLVLHQADKSHPTAAGSYLYGAPSTALQGLARRTRLPQRMRKTPRPRTPPTRGLRGESPRSSVKMTETNKGDSS
ncbi:MAG: hypothetical protein ACLUHG_02445 [Sutterella wadsworthensis]